MAEANQPATRVAIVGCGAVAAQHAAAVHRLPDDIQLVACADVVHERADAFAHEHNVPRMYGDYRRMVESESPDLVIITTWPVQHEMQVFTCVDLGAKAVLCHPPLAMHVAAAAAVGRAAREAGTLVAESLPWRHHPRILAALDLLHAGRLGDLQQVRVGIRLNREKLRPWRTRVEYGGGVAFDLLCAMLHAATACLPDGPIIATAEADRLPDGVIESLRGTLRVDEAGPTAEVEASFGEKHEEWLKLIGSEATVRVTEPWKSGDGGALEVVRDEQVETPEVEAGDAHECQLLHLRARLADGESPRIPIARSIAVAAARDAMLTASRTDRPVPARIPSDFAPSQPAT